MAAKQLVHGDDLLYRFFRDVFLNEPDEGLAMSFRLLEATAIWWPLHVYREWPILLPWVVRDPACRGKKSQGIPDQWSAPDEGGYLRDDNSLLKALPRRLPVLSTVGNHLNGKHMGKEFVAAHVWREVAHSKLASRLPQLNSFVPNLVWLPSQVAKLSDLEGSPLQRALQTMSWAIYRNAEVASHLSGPAEESWGLIPEPKAQSVDLTRLNWFVPDERFLRTRGQRLQTVVSALRTLRDGGTLATKVIATRYTEGLPGVAAEARAALLAQLETFLSTNDPTPLSA